jgi:serine phosphatase RsbU (regulator of sigma subunit)
VALNHPERLLGSVNQLFYENTVDSAYASLFFAEYDDQTRRLRYANCGHLSDLLLQSNNSMKRLDSTSTLLGLFKEWDCSLQECELSPGDTLALYTDGVSEASNDVGEEFGEQRLIESLRRHRGVSSEALIAALINEILQFSPREQYDDITLIVANCRRRLCTELIR